MAMNVPKVPPPWIIVFPTLCTSSLPLIPNLLKKIDKILILRKKKFSSLEILIKIFNYIN